MSAQPFFIAPFGKGVFLIDECLLRVQKSPDGKIDKVELRRESGEEIVVVHESWNWRTKEDKREEGHSHSVQTVYQFYRNRSWALKEVFEVRSAVEHGSTTERTFHRYFCVYRGEKDGVPLLAEYSSSGGLLEPVKRKSTVAHRVYEVTQIVPDSPPLSAFDPEQFEAR
jgi:hypothetical protein